MRRSGLSAALTVAAFAIGCGDDGNEAGPPREVMPQVVIKDDSYMPRRLRVEAGSRVVFANRGTDTHSAKDDPEGRLDISPQPGPTAHDGSEVNRASEVGFATHALFPGERQTVVFPVARTYRFQCSFHDMKGTIEVVPAR